MGIKYTIRTDEVREFPSGNENYTEYYTSSFIEFIKILIIKRKNLIYARRDFY